MMKDLQSIVQISYTDSEMALKMVDKYEFQESESHLIDGVQFITAKHTISKQPFTLKKLSLQEDSNGKYQSLVNQLLVLKEVNAEWAVQCHKMLKTSNNLYLVYDLITQHTLSSALRVKKQPSIAQIKENIAGQLVNILIELKQKGIANLNITPNTIQLISPLLPSRNSKSILRLNSFEYAVFMRHVLNAKIFINLPPSQFKAPELELSPPVMGYHCDLYSVGKILEWMGFSKEEGGCSDDRIEVIKQVISKMTRTDFRTRVTIQQILPIFEAKSIENSSKNIQRSKTLTTSHKSKQFQQNYAFPRQMSRKLTFQDSQRQKQKQNTNFRKYILQILKRRNLSIFLMKCCQACSRSTYTEIDSILRVSFLLLKKSTQIIAQLSKFLMTGHDPHIKIPQKQHNSFFKSQDYFKLQAQISRQMNLSKKHLNLTLEKITKTFPNLFKDEEFAHETKQERINQQYFKTTVLTFLKESAKNDRILREDKAILQYFVLMSFLSNLDTYQRMFDQLIHEEIVQLDSQALLLKVAQYSPLQMIQKLRQMCNK